MTRRIPTLLRVRRIFEQRALAKLAEGQRRLRDAEHSLERRQEAYRRRPVTAATLTPLQLRALELQGVGAYAAVEAAGEQAAEAEAVHDALRVAWTQAAVQRESIERLDQRRAEQAVAAAEAVRTRALEDLVTLRHGRDR